MCYCHVFVDVACMSLVCGKSPGNLGPVDPLSPVQSTAGWTPLLLWPPTAVPCMTARSAASTACPAWKLSLWEPWASDTPRLLSASVSLRTLVLHTDQLRVTAVV